MGKKKIRKCRWDYRAHVKFESNRCNNEKAMHPQVRRQLEEERFQRKDLDK